MAAMAEVATPRWPPDHPTRAREASSAVAVSAPIETADAIDVIAAGEGGVAGRAVAMQAADATAATHRVVVAGWRWSPVRRPRWY